MMLPCHNMPLALASEFGWKKYSIYWWTWLKMSQKFWHLVELAVGPSLGRTRRNSGWRGIYGVYHQVSAKHLERYVNEFAFRLNEGNVARHSIERLNSFVDAVAGKRITLKQVTA